MIKSILLILIIGYFLFELFEHLLFPLYLLIKNRNRQPLCGVSAMLNKVGEVRQWEKNGGKVFVKGELWKAVGHVKLLPGDKVIIQDLEGLTLKVKPLEKSNPFELP
jgi:membrane-bound ClpP family serine protease